VHGFNFLFVVGGIVFIMITPGCKKIMRAVQALRRRNVQIVLTDGVIEGFIALYCGNR
tara:strand:+ start:6216 stop:6389 length:174 start_codon:yes stop_codon:yes gene_type:complete